MRGSRPSSRSPRPRGFPCLRLGRCSHSVVPDPDLSRGRDRRRAHVAGAVLARPQGGRRIARP
eukprot:14425405-Alexandrium_andersonii.AAC.1